MGKILIVGAGYMADNYLKFLKSKKHEIILVGKRKKYSHIKKRYQLNETFVGGLENFSFRDKKLDKAIVAVNEKYAFKVTKILIKNRIKNILIEKPGAKNLNELVKLDAFSKKVGCKIYCAYNRRFYENITLVKKFTQRQGGILSANFSFTEWTDKIRKGKFENYLKFKWFYFNSLHLIDLCFFIIGKPKKYFSIVKGYNKEFNNNIFTGSGISVKNIPFSYHSNWLSSGRWEINLYTKKGKFLLAPLEDIKFQKKFTRNRTNKN